MALANPELQRTGLSRWKAWLLTLASGVVRAGIWIGATVFRIRDARMMALGSAAERAVERGATEKARSLARQLLARADANREDWTYGNAIHQGHLVLGRVALAVGDIETAKEELLAAGRTPGSPQLDSFGPNMRLAKDLLEVGERDAVLRYFELCGTFWKLHRERLAAWTADVKEGRPPAFGPNLVY